MWWSKLKQYLIKMCVNEHYFRFNKNCMKNAYLSVYYRESVVTDVLCSFLDRTTLEKSCQLYLFWHTLLWIWNNSVTLMNRYWFSLLPHTRSNIVPMFEKVVFFETRNHLSNSWWVLVYTLWRKLRANLSFANVFPWSLQLHKKVSKKSCMGHGIDLVNDL